MGADVDINIEVGIETMCTSARASIRVRLMHQPTTFRPLSFHPSILTTFKVVQDANRRNPIRPDIPPCLRKLPNPLANSNQTLSKLTVF